VFKSLFKSSKHKNRSLSELVDLLEFVYQVVDRYEEQSPLVEFLGKYYRNDADGLRDAKVRAHTVHIWCVDHACRRYDDETKLQGRIAQLSKRHWQEMILKEVGMMRDKVELAARRAESLFRKFDTAARRNDPPGADHWLAKTIMDHVTGGLETGRVPVGVVPEAVVLETRRGIEGETQKILTGAKA
jgi:hypothetical protein